MNNVVEKIGIVATFRISAGGGAPRVAVDLVNALNSMDKKVYLLTPFRLDYKKIKDFHGPLKIEKTYYPNKLKSLFCKGRALSRKLIKKEFKKMAKEVDMIIDIDGGFVHNYLPKDFDKSKYIVWRISGILSESKKKWVKRGIKREIKEMIKVMSGGNKCIPSEKHHIYAVNKWTKKELKDYLNLKSEDILLYPKIKVEEFLKEKRKKKNQIIIFGRIAPGKCINDSIKIFAKGTKKFPEYKLIIIGGKTADTEKHLLKLNKTIKEFGVSNRVKIIIDPSFEEIKKVLSESKVSMSSQRRNSMTMTSLESMASGCIVLNYKDSGVYIDILDCGKFGYGFSSLEEGAKKLELILDRLKKGEINNKKSIERSKDFSGEVFAKRLKKIIET